MNQNQDMMEMMQQSIMQGMVQETIEKIIRSDMSKNKLVQCPKCKSVYKEKVVLVRKISAIELSLHNVPINHDIEVPIELLRCASCKYIENDPFKKHNDMEDAEIIKEEKKSGENLIVLK